MLLSKKKKRFKQKSKKSTYTLPPAESARETIVTNKHQNRSSDPTYNENLKNKESDKLLSKEELRKKNLEYMKNKDFELISKQSKKEIVLTLPISSGILTKVLTDCSASAVLKFGLPVAVGVGIYLFLKGFLGW